MTHAEQVFEAASDSSLFDIDKFRAQLAESANPMSLFRDTIKKNCEILDERFRQNEDIVSIVTGRAWFMDQLLRCAWEQYDWGSNDDVSLLAVGGYGRGELLPYSDIDLLLLTRSDDVDQYKDSITAFLTFLWDINLDVGQSVRSLSQCRQEALKDITVTTSLMESRTIVGPESLREEMIAFTQNDEVWPPKEFFRAKRDEQLERHDKYYDIDYALEPNVKTSPGGLRDIQTIGWIAKRHYRAETLGDLVKLGFLNDLEYKQLMKGEKLLWTLRYGLHMLAGRKEDRLLFDKQKDLAKLFGYEDDDKSLAVEKLMQEYYRVVATLRGLNDVLLQHFDEAILRADEKEEITVLNNRFQIRDDYIEVVSDDTFERFPFALLEIFVLMAQEPKIKGVRATTIRLIRENRKLINDDFRNDIRNTTLFMELIRSPHDLTAQLRRMARYGVLGLYLPEFGAITGKMQHDLFHIYTVDAHTLQVVENMRRFRLPDAIEKFPIASHIVKRLPKLELLYVAGLYHDIAKGRGGDHSTLGMVDAADFCKRHHLSPWDTKLVCWLIGKHLLMSMTAQRMDIADPEVIQQFALEMGDKLHLDYLYALTVADINATNPTLWSTWRASLLRQLYMSTKRALRRGLENPIDRSDRISDKQASAMDKLRDHEKDETEVKALWENIDDEYFVRESASNIAWHTEALLDHKGQETIVLIDEQADGFAEGATQIFVYTTNKRHIFASSAAAMEQLGLDIQDARLFTTAKNFCMNTFTVLEDGGNPVSASPARRSKIIELLTRYLAEPEKHLQVPNKRIERKLKHFSQHVETEVINRDDTPYTTLEINCPDHPGVLATIGKVFAEQGIELQNARIATLGERVEDLFYILDQNNNKLTDPAAIERLRSAMEEELGK
ncbi:MAG: [protein-PII] uridylyltransferase [Pseudohongiellaceae bacterium]|nr:[protein-PII] uridylyltransferase [Pseudohongiellaceae bacterium]